MLSRLRAMTALLASAAAVSAVGAADLPSRKGPPIYVPPALTWTGFYLGFNRAYGGGVFEADATVSGAFFGIPLGTTNNTLNRAAGWSVGGQIGYNYQLANNLVLGVETDLQWANVKASHQAATSATFVFLNTYADIHQGVEWYGTTRGRAGYSFGRVMPYVTGGVAYGGVEASGLQVLAAGLTTQGSSRATKVGWAAGAGAEIALSSHFSAKAEYLFLSLPGIGGPSIGVLPPPLPLLTGAFATRSFDVHMVRVGLNYRFGGAGDFASIGNGGVLAFLTQPPALDWTGFYVGANGGYGGGVVKGQTVFVEPPVFPFFPGLAFSTTASNRAGGAIAGGQAGYNHQFANRFVLGVETDMQWSGVEAWHQATTFGGPGAFVFTDTANGLSWFGTTRVRAGYAVGDALAYLTGGVAFGEIYASGTQASGGYFAAAAARTKAGWTAGAGVEYALTDNLSLKTEYLYLNFSGVSGPAAGLAVPPLPPFVGSFSTGAFATHNTRVGLNWRLGGYRAPAVIASY